MKKNYLIILLTLNSIFAHSQYNTETKFLNFEGYERSFEIYLPINYSDSINYPVVFILHGGGGTAKGLIRSTYARFNKLADRENFIAVYPNGVEKSWNDGARDTIAVARKLNINDVAFFEKMIETIQSNFSVDNDKIFACGISNGGFMVQRLAFELSDEIKGIGVVVANLSEIQSEKTFPENPASVIFINGENDPIVPYFGGQVTVFKTKRGEVLSVEKSINIWKEINDCTKSVNNITFANRIKNDNCTATKAEWVNPNNSNIKVTEIKIINGGHSWPGTKHNLPKWLVGNINRDINGCDEIWSFFESLK